MPKVDPLKNDFSAGEVGNFVQGRVDSQLYARGAARILNYVPTVEGPVTRFPGTRFTAATKTNAASALIRLKLSQDTAYAIEVSSTGVLRFYRNDGTLIEDGGSAYELSHDFTVGEYMTYIQKGKDVYIFTPSVPIQKLTYVSETEWTLAYAEIYGGPYAPNVSYSSARTLSMQYAEATPPFTRATGTVVPKSLSITAAASGTGGVVRLTTGVTAHGFQDGDYVSISGIVGTTEANGDYQPIRKVSGSAVAFELPNVPFVHAYVSGGTVRFNPVLPGDEGKLFRLVSSGTTYEMFVDFISNVLFQGDLYPQDVDIGVGTTGQVTTWNVGVWGGDNGFPQFGTFHEDRLCVSGVDGANQRIFGSVPGAYDNFDSDDDGTPTAASAIDFELNNDDLSEIVWLESDTKGLLAGTISGANILTAANPNAAFSALNVKGDRNDGTGSAKVDPIRAGTAVVFAQKSGKTLRDFIYDYSGEKFLSANLSRAGRHLFATQIAEFAYQELPFPIIWIRLTSGVVLGCLYDNEGEGTVSGIFEVRFGGRSDVANRAPICESMVVLPDETGGEEQLWVILKRRVNGATKRYIERVEVFFGEETDQRDAVFSDSAVLGGNADVVLPGTLMAENPLRLATSGGSGIVANDVLFFKNVQGMTQIGSGPYLVTSVVGNNILFGNVDASTYSAHIPDASTVYRKGTETIDGLDHLEGETVSVLADGIVHAPCVVTGGEIELDAPAGWVVAGLPKTAQLKTLRFEGGSRQGTALGKNRRNTSVALLVNRTGALKYGVDFDSMYPIDFTPLGADVDAMIPVYSGLVPIEQLNSNFDLDGTICFEQTDPLPGTICAVLPRMDLQDAG